ncbi:uncharacterized protein BO87DRAFT_75615 [Aspergillus neoniger CBS 115656]|uniref:Uncharacterized protein n=1 Tax=Aspergillus neoniger (strain CBS 115656) TaxID=1448310 RepID=A0A318Z5N6_ASPNB|nr:hypothetical protein BO87DRAFT_75615 [Aspergillus neoniger CBS 115656]PYH39020.1 hypothetical protein BO87DRAFT_75615 [Aspergillus neoniger CBS 115656]
MAEKRDPLFIGETFGSCFTIGIAGGCVCLWTVHTRVIFMAESRRKPQPPGCSLRSLRSDACVIDKPPGLFLSFAVSMFIIAHWLRRIHIWLTCTTSA